MSKSRRKFPIVKSEKSCKTGKRFANRKVRHHKDIILKGNYYKKLYCSWNICDYIFYVSEDDIKNSWNAKQKALKHGVDSWTFGVESHISLEEALTNWKKRYVNK